MNEYDRIVKQNAKYLDEFRGCLIGGAAGDALGYPVEFQQNCSIRHRYGEDGIRAYDLSPNGKAWISDDTQMTLFTALGLINGYTRSVFRGISSEPFYYVGHAYQIWYQLQKRGIEEADHLKKMVTCGWLVETPEMAESRAPGATCMSVIGSGKFGSVDQPINDSKGCGGIMRVAPVGLTFNRPRLGGLDWLWEQAAAVAALTHGHELGWLPAAVLAHIVNRLVYSVYTVEGAVADAQAYLKAHYEDRKYTADLIALINKARELARNKESDYDNISSLGGGWVAEETLAIAVYCSIRYEDDFSAAICAAVNHDGDSDSTGAVTGNIMGALWGYERIPDQWKQNLECSDVILRVADELCHLNELHEEPWWETKNE